jgi:16S rRNA (cytosine967-C5)-methyltransferase
MKNARQIAFSILLKIQNDDAYSNLSLSTAIENNQLDDKETALLSALIYGTLERLITIDYNLKRYLKKNIKNLRPEILSVLRLGACQLLFMDKIPVSAAVNESVNIIKQTKCAYASGLVNAVLRKIAYNGLYLPEESDNQIYYYSVKYSCPEWLILLWQKSYGSDNAIGILEYSLIQSPDFVRINCLATNTEELIKKLGNEGVESEVYGDNDETLILNKTGSVERLESFKKGLYHFQDISSQMFCRALGAKTGDIIFDLCAAPGGKAFTLAQQVGEKGKIYAYDIHKSRLELIRKGATRLGLKNIIVNFGDACVYNHSQGLADIVICDVPCSGFGVIRRKPEIRYKNPVYIDKLPELQYFILCNASRYVKNGGVLAYSTCTLNTSENEDVCEHFLKEHTNYIPVTDNVADSETGRFTTILPHKFNSDGFFYALFKRME